MALTEASASRRFAAKVTRAVDLLRRHQQTLLRLGDITMIAVGVLLVTGIWDLATATLRQWAAQFTTMVRLRPLLSVFVGTDGQIAEPGPLRPEPTMIRALAAHADPANSPPG